MATREEGLEGKQFHLNQWFKGRSHEVLEENMEIPGGKPVYHRGI